MKYTIISVDYQNDFCSEKGKYYRDRPCHSFIQNEFIPFLKENNIKLAEILCDYRLPRAHETESWCVPGEWGYQSAIDEAVKLPDVWIKSMDSPEWIRENSGDPTKKPGLPYQNPYALDQWLKNTIGNPEEAGEIILIGLTFECCVLNTAIQLHNRNYKVKILKEGTDIFDLSVVAEYIKSGRDYKDFLFSTSHREYAKSIQWSELKTGLLEMLKEQNVNRLKVTELLI